MNEKPRALPWFFAKEPLDQPLQQAVVQSELSLSLLGIANVNFAAIKIWQERKEKQGWKVMNKAIQPDRDTAQPIHFGTRLYKPSTIYKQYYR